MTGFTDFIDVTGAAADRAPLVKGGIRAYYATGTGGIEETAAQVAAARAAGMGVVLIDQTPSLSVFASGIAHVADVENFAGTVTSAIGAVKAREARGLDSDLYVSYNGLVALASALLNAVAAEDLVRFWVADYSWSLAEAQQRLAQNPNWAAVQYGDPHSNPDTLVPGTSVTLAQCNADIDVARSDWAARFLPPPPVPPAGPPPAVHRTARWPVTKEGAAGRRVLVLQYLLRAHGELLLPDRIFGPLTRRSVEAWQRARRIAVDGIAGPQTWPTLTPVTAEGARGEAVRAVQRVVLTADDGMFGPATRKAVIAFQKANGLAPDGIVGPQTWPALVSAA